MGKFTVILSDRAKKDLLAIEKSGDKDFKAGRTITLDEFKKKLFMYK